MRCKRTIARWMVAIAPLICARGFAASPETPEQTRHRLESMTAAEKEDLLRKKERFEKLSSEEQARYRKLHEQVTTDPEADRLKHVMTRYCDWLKTLSAEQKVELEKLPADKRVAKVKELMKIQEEARVKALMGVQLPPDDLKKIYDWLEDYVKQNEVPLLAKLPLNTQRWIRGERDVVKRLANLRWMLFSQGGGHFLAGVPEDELNTLLGSLKSSEAQKAIEAAREPEKKRLLVQRWIGAAVFARMNPPVSDAELRRFYVEDLDSINRERLELLPREEMQRELRKLYHRDKFRKANEAQRPFGSPPFVGPGGSGGPGGGGPGGPGGPGAGPGGDGPKDPRPPFGRGNDQRGPRDGGPREGKPREGQPTPPEREPSLPKT